MHERTTNPERKRETKEIYSPAETPNSQEMARDGKWLRGSLKTSKPSPNSLSLEEILGTRRSDPSERKETSARPSGPEGGERESKLERGFGSTDPRADAFKKRDELGLMNRSMAVLWVSSASKPNTKKYFETIIKYYRPQLKSGFS